MDLVGDDVGEERQLVAPALDVVIAHGRVGEGVDEVKARPRATGSSVIVTRESPGAIGTPFT
jgi:hypothetical protein